MSSSSGISHKPPTQVNKSVRPSSANSNPFPGLTTPSADYTNPFNYEFGDAGSSSSKKRKAVDADFNSNLKTYEHSLKSSRMSVGGSGGVRVGSSGEVGTEHPNYHQMRIKLEEEKLREELLAFNANRLSQAQQNKQTQQATVIKKAPPSLSQLTPVSSSSSATTSSSSSSAKSSSIIKKPAIPTTASHSHSHSHLQQALSSSTTINSSQLAKKMKMISPGSGQSSSGARNENPRTAVAESADDSSFKSSVTQIFGTAVTEVVSNQLWICPSCNRHDESTPMIGCDSCDDWYHWSCIGITEEPPENQNWYCHKCGKNTSGKSKTAVAGSRHAGVSSRVAANEDGGENSRESVGGNSNDAGLSSSYGASDYLANIKKKKKKST